MRTGTARFTLATLGLSALACADPAAEGSDTSDTPAGGGGGGDLVNSCGVWANVEQDRAWDYRYTGTSSGDSTVEVTRLKSGSGEETSQGSLSGSGYTQDFTSVVKFSCDDGLVMSSMTTQYAGTTGSTSYSGETTTTYDEAVKVWPADLAKGDTWTSHYAGTIKDQDGNKTRFDYDTDYEVVKLEDVSVKAGDYSALKITGTTTQDGNTTTFNEWVVSGVGVVKTDGSELTDYRP